MRDYDHRPKKYKGTNQSNRQENPRFVTDGGEAVTDADSETNDHLSYCISSRYRLAVLDALADGAATPSTIADEEDVGIAHVSRALKSLEERDLVELIVPDERKKGRLYELADDGAHLLNKHGDVIERNRSGA